MEQLERFSATASILQRKLADMARRPCTFREADVRRALRAAKAAGVTVHIKIERRSGDLVIMSKKPDDASTDMPASEQTPPEDIVL